MEKMICLECGHSFNFDKSKECPICKNSNEKLLLKPIEVKDIDNKLGLGDEKIKMSIKKLLVDKTHSVAYIKLCAKMLEENGYMSLARSLEEIARRKSTIEMMLLDIYGIKDDLRLNLNNVLMRAEEDVKHSYLISQMAKDNNEEELYNLMKDLVKEEALNLTLLNGVLKDYLKEDIEKKELIN